MLVSLALPCCTLTRVQLHAAVYDCLSHVLAAAPGALHLLSRDELARLVTVCIHDSQAVTAEKVTS